MTVKKVDKHLRTTTGAAVVEIENLIQSNDGVSRVLVSDEDAHGVLSDILLELKKINFHLSLMTDTNINDTEVTNA